MINASDLAGVRTRSGGSDRSDARIQALEERFNELLSGLEDLVSTARGNGNRRRGRG